MNKARKISAAIITVQLAAGLMAAGVLAAGAAYCQDKPDQFQAWGKVAKSDPYLGDPGLTEPGKVAAEASQQEKDRGFVVFAKTTSDIVKPDYIPKADERCASLEAADCRGQYGAVTFFIFAVNGGDFAVKATDLAGPKDKKITASNLDIRAVQYVKPGTKNDPDAFPLLIEAFDKKTLPANRLQQFWITYYIPKDVAPGKYTGEVQVLVGGEKKFSLPLNLTVYGFDLAEPGVNLYMYYNNTADKSKLPQLLKHMVDQRCHDMTMSMLDPPMDYNANDIKRDEYPPMLTAYKEAAFPSNYLHVELSNRIICEWVNTPDKTTEPPMWGAWFRYYPFTKELDEKYLKAVRFIDDECKKRGLKLMFAVADEAGSHAWTQKATQHYNELIRDNMPDVVRELTCGGGWASGDAEDQLWKGRINIWTTNRWLVDKLEIVRKDDPKAKIQIYNMCGPGSTSGGVGSARANYGFFGWKAKADGVTQWIYWTGGQPTNIYTWPAEDASDGMVPTLHWEAVRKGAKDRRYLATLEKSLTGKKDATAEAARKFLTEIAGKIELKNVDYDVINGGRVPSQPPGVYDQWRATIADFCQKLSGGQDK